MHLLDHMYQIFRWRLLPILLFIGPIAAWIVFGAIKVKQLRRHKAGDQAYVLNLLSSPESQENLLSAGRALIKEYTQSRSNRVDLSHIPEAIMRVQPRDMFIYGDQVHVLINSPGRRTFIVCFAEGAEEFGTCALTNGLWYWNVNMSGDEFPALDRLIKRENAGKQRLWVSFERDMGIPCDPYIHDFDLLTVRDIP